MTRKELLQFVELEMMEENESLPREPEQAGPFAVALIELAAGGYVIRITQPDVILRNRKSKLESIYQVGPWGPRSYTQAARRFNILVDEDLA